MLLLKFSQGIPTGGIHVDLAFEALLRARLQSLTDRGVASSLIPQAIQDFEIHAKRKFNDVSVPSFIQVGKADLYNKELGVEKGKLRIDGCV